MSFRMIYLAKRNPQVAFEDWPRTWRSHAVYVSQFPTIGGSIDKLHYCARQPEVPAGWSGEYDGVALVDSASRETLGGNMEPDVKQLVDKDERRVFSTLVDEFTMFFNSTAILGNCRGKGVAIRFLRRAPGVDPAAFKNRLEAHAGLASSLIDGKHVSGYEQYAISEAPPPGYEYDAVTLDWFETPEAALAAATEGTLQGLERDLGEFCDMSGSVNLLTRVVHEWPREAA